MYLPKSPRSLWAALFCLCLLVIGCQTAPPPASDYPIQSQLSGRVTVRAAVDSIPDYSNFEVLIVWSKDGDVDTLGYALTDAEGNFETPLKALQRGIYPIFISRLGQLLQQGEMVIADGDTATLNVQLPWGNRPLLVRSFENGAWLAYKNTKAQHNTSLLAVLPEDDAKIYDVSEIGNVNRQTSAILWSLQENYPGTIGAAVAAAESIAMLEGWDDVTLLNRLGSFSADNPSYVDVIRAARRAMARVGGLVSSVDLVQQAITQVENPEDKAALMSEVVVAFMDSSKTELAARAALLLQEDYPESAWAEWADRALYELDNLMPGMSAPDFLAQTISGEEVKLGDQAGNIVMLEYYTPQSQRFLQELETRNAVANALADQPFSLLSISLEPDSTINAALFDGRDLPGTHIIAPQGAEGALAELYNVNLLPTRFLIDWNGRIVGKYVGAEMNRLQQDLLVLFAVYRERS